MTREKTIFEKIISGEIPCHKIYEDEQIFAFLDINPSGRGHTLVIPKEPYENIHDMPDEVAQKLIVVVKKISAAVKKAVTADAIMLRMNNGAASGQMVFHAHMHIVPKFDNEKLAPGEHIKYAEGEAAETSEKIIAELA